MEQALGPFEINKIYLGDALVLLKEIPDETIDLIITDPPFGIEFKAKKDELQQSRT
jgi:DNA modification methylase